LSDAVAAVLYEGKHVRFQTNVPGSILTEVQRFFPGWASAVKVRYYKAPIKI